MPFSSTEEAEERGEPHEEINLMQGRQETSASRPAARRPKDSQI